jgi:hypothetical protein
MLIRELIVRHLHSDGAVHVRGTQLNWAQVPAGVRVYQEGADDGAPVQGDLVVVRAPVGPGLREHLSGDLPLGTALALLLDVEVTELPVGRVLAALTFSGLQVVEAVVVTGAPEAMVAVVAIRTDELIAPAPYLAHELEPDGTAGGQAVLQRLLGEHTLEGLVHRARERALLAELGGAAAKLKEGTGELERRLSDITEQEAAQARDLKNVRGDLDAARREADSVRQKMLALRSSTSFKMASSLARAWRLPRRVLRRSAGMTRR